MKAHDHSKPNIASLPGDGGVLGLEARRVGIRYLGVRCRFNINYTGSLPLETSKSEPYRLMVVHMLQVILVYTGCWTEASSYAAVV